MGIFKIQQAWCPHSREPGWTELPLAVTPLFLSVPSSFWWAPSLFSWTKRYTLSACSHCSASEPFYFFKNIARQLWFFMCYWVYWVLPSCSSDVLGKFMESHVELHRAKAFFLLFWNISLIVTWHIHSICWQSLTPWLRKALLIWNNTEQLIGLFYFNALLNFSHIALKWLSHTHPSISLYTNFLLFQLQIWLWCFKNQSKSVGFRNICSRLCV